MASTGLRLFRDKRGSVLGNCSILVQTGGINVQVKCNRFRGVKVRKTVSKRFHVDCRVKECTRTYDYTRGRW